VRFLDICRPKIFVELARAGQTDPLMAMPAICVEVTPPGSRRKIIEAKIQAKLGVGVLEVLFVEQDGPLRWFAANGEQSRSMHAVTLQLPD
jgi:hypothetical protein